MQIKCPKCRTEYNVPETTVGNAPRKMRCVRCATIFAVARRAETPPAGYEEYAGRPSALPADFSFLQQIKKPDSKPVLPRQDNTLLGQPQTNSTNLEKSILSARAKTHGYVATPEEDRGDPIPPAPEKQAEEIETTPDPAAEKTPDATVLEADNIPQADVPADVTKDDEPTDPEPVAPSTAVDVPQEEPLPAPPEPAVYSTLYSIMPESDVIDEWETESPLDLTDFAVTEARRGPQLIGKFITVTILLAALFVIFVAYRNAWTLSVPDFFSQVKTAISGDQVEQLPDAVDDLEALVDEYKIIRRPGRKPILSVVGQVFNNSRIARTHIVLRGRLIDSNQTVRAQTRVPCGVLIDEEKIKAATSETVSGFYQTDSRLYNCGLQSESSTLFQFLFTEVPIDFDHTFTIKAQIVSARYPG